MLSRLRTKVLNLPQSLLTYSFPRDLWYVLLHLKPPGFTKPQFKLATYVLLAAKQTVARTWKQQFIPFTEVSRRLDFFFTNEILYSILLDTYETILKIWTRWVQYAQLSMPTASYLLL